MTRIALIGTGNISGVHLRFLKSRPDVQIVGLCDIKEQNLRRRQEEFGGKGYEKYLPMIDDLKPDAVWICTPPTVRREPLLACAERGIPVFCEKPVEKSAEGADAITADLARLGARVQIGYVFRSMPSVQRLRAEIATDRVHFVSSSYSCDVSLLMNLPPWFYDKDQSGGALVDQGTHNFDLLRYLLGEVEELRGIARNPVRKKERGYTVDEAISISLAFASGAVGSHTHTWVGKGWRNEIVLGGEKRTYRLDPFKGNLIIEEGAETRTFQQEARAIHDFQNQVFLSMLASGDWSACPVDYADGARTLRLTLACNRSLSEKGGSVRP